MPTSVELKWQPRCNRSSTCPRRKTDPTDIILITDGEIYDVEGVVNLAGRSRHRLFAIAIGAAPVEALARSTRR